MPPKMLFADTFDWVARLNRRGPFHTRVVAFSYALGATRLVTTDEVFTEVLNWFSGSRRLWRRKAAALIHDLRSNSKVDVLAQTRADFDAALALYEARPDKKYSLPDCRSMLAMKGLGLTEILTNDHHFTQEGFTILFPTP